MNFKSVIFSGIMTALVGAMIGLALVKISQRELRAKAIIIGGAALGFAVGAFYDSIRQQAQEEEEEFGESDGSGK